MAGVTIEQYKPLREKTIKDHTKLFRAIGATLIRSKKLSKVTKERRITEAEAKYVHGL